MEKIVTYKYFRDTVFSMPTIENKNMYFNKKNCRNKYSEAEFVILQFYLRSDTITVVFLIFLLKEFGKLLKQD